MLLGKQGCCIAIDQCCEHYVRKIKDLLKSFHNQLEPALVEKAVLSYNPMLVIKDHVLGSLGKQDMQSGGGHRDSYLSFDEVFLTF